MNPGFVHYAKFILIMKTYLDNIEFANINDSDSMRTYFTYFIQIL